MNFYKRFIGDIQSKTGHLSLAEFGAYDRLLDHCYSTEQLLPLDMDACCRIARAMSPAERRAVESVVRQFFQRTDDGYVQPRVQEMLADAAPKISAARENGKRGGRRKNDQNGNPTGTQTEPNGFQNGNPTGTQTEPNGFQNGNPTGTQTEPNGLASQSQSQIKNTEKDTPLKPTRARPPATPPVRACPDPDPGDDPGGCAIAGPPPDPPHPSPSAAAPTPAATVCQRLRSECAIPGVNPSHPKLLALLAAGAQWAEFADAARAAAGKKDPFAYVLAVVERRRTDAAEMAPRLHTGPLTNRQEAIEAQNRAVAEQWLRGTQGAAA